MKIIYTIIAFIATVVAMVQAQMFLNCAGSADMRVNQLSVFPYPLCRLSSVSILVNGWLNAPITAGGKLNLLGKYLGTTVYTDSQDLCWILSASGYPCPIPTSVTQISMMVYVKASIPVNINMVFTISATNGNGNTLFCQSANNFQAKAC